MDEEVRSGPPCYAHVKARLALAKKVIRRRLEWGLLGRKLPSDEQFLRMAFEAISRHKWHENWGARYSKYEMFGGPQKIIGTYKDVPASEVHQIMCRMKF